jgi:hypothetical protein
MALVKKLQNAGSIPDSFASNVDKVLSGYKLRAKDEALVRKKLSDLKSGIDLKNLQISFDDVAKTYNVSGMGAENYAGTPDYLKTNFFTGNVSVKDPSEINNLVARIYQEASNYKVPEQTQTTTPTTKTALPLSTFEQYMVKSKGEANYNYDRSQMKDNLTRQKYYMDNMKNLLQGYIDEASKSTGSEYDYADVEKAKQLLEVTNRSNWDEFLPEAQKLQFTPQDILITGEEQQSFDANTQADQQKTLQDQVTTINETLSGLGLDPSKLYGQDPYNPNKLIGWTEIDNDWVPKEFESNPEWFKNLLTSKNAVVLKNHLGKHRIVSGGKDFNYTQFKVSDPFYGYSIRSTEEGSFADNPNITSRNFLSSYKYPTRAENAPIRITQLNSVINTPGFENYSVWGDPSSNFKRLALVSGNNRQWLSQNEQGKYIDATGKVVNISPIIGEFQNARIITAPGAEFDKLAGDIESTYSSPAQLLGDLQNTSKNGTMLASNGRIWENSNKLLWMLKNKSKLDPVRQAELKRLEPAIKNWLTSYNKWLSTQVPANKKGGNIQYAKSGASFKDVLAKSKTPTVKGAQPSEIRNISGSMRNQTAGENALDIASLIGTGASFIPGVGAIGGLVATGADAWKGSLDGWDSGDTKNLLANLGFTALSLIGAGGLKSVKLLKMAKSADAASDVAKFGKKASDARAVLSAKGVNSMDDISKIANNTERIELTKLYRQANKTKGSVTGLVNKAVNSEKLAKVTPWMAIPTVAGGAMGAYNLGAEALKSGDLSLASSDDVKSVARAASVVRGFAGNQRLQRALTNQTESSGGTSAKTTFKVKGSDKALTVDETIQSPKEIKRGLSPKTWKKSETLDKKNAENTSSVQKKLADSYNKGKADADKIKSEDIEVSSIENIGASAGTIKLRDNMNFSERYGTNSSKAEKDYELARKYLELGKAKRFAGLPERRVKSEKVSSAVQETSPITPVTPAQTPAKGRSLKPFKVKRKEKVSEKITETKLLPKSTTNTSMIKSDVKPIKKEGPSRINKLEEVLKTKGLSKQETVIAKNKLKTLKASQPKKIQSKNTRPKKDKVSEKSNVETMLTNLKNKSKPTKEPKYSTLPSERRNSRLPGSKKNSPPAQKLTNSTKKKLGRLENGGVLFMQNGSTGMGNKLSFKDYLSKLGKYSENLDEVDYTNIFSALANKVYNTQSQKSQNRALTESYYSTPKMARTMVPVVANNSLTANKLANEYMSKAGKVARSTSDFNKSAAVSLAGAKEALGIEEKGKLLDSEALMKQRLMQTQMDSQREQYNLGAETKDRALAADINSKIHKVNVNRLLTEGQNAMNLANRLAANSPYREYKKLSKQMFELSQDPEIKTLQKKYEDLNSESGRKIYEDKFNADKKLHPSINFGFNDSTYYRQWETDVKALKDLLEAKLEPINTLRAKSSLMFKSGGGMTVSDKAFLENLKNRNKRRLKELDILAKTIMEDNKLLQQALIKVFK